MSTQQSRGSAAEVAVLLERLVDPRPAAALRRTWDVLADVAVERGRQEAKHGERTLANPEQPAEEKLPALVEEVGEVAHELTYDAGGTPESLYGELVQVAACAVAWAEALRRKYASTHPRICADARPQRCGIRHVEPCGCVWRAVDIPSVDVDGMGCWIGQGWEQVAWCAEHLVGDAEAPVEVSDGKRPGRWPS